MPLPFQDHIYLDESGPGYALRMAGENYLTFSQIIREVASLGHCYIPNTSAEKIAFWFGADPSQLCRAIQRTYRKQGVMVTSFMGHNIHWNYHIRQTRPQICPLCLWQYGRAFASWDVRLVTCCPEHRCQLVDKCEECGRPISWRRPSLFQCQCGAIFLSSVQEYIPSREERWLSQHICNLLCPEQVRATNIINNKYAWLAEFSLHALLRFIWAIGVTNEERKREKCPQGSCFPHPKDASALVNRFFNRIDRLINMSQDDPLDISKINTDAILALINENSSIGEHFLLTTIMYLLPISTRERRAIIEYFYIPQLSFDFYNIPWRKINYTI